MLGASPDAAGRARAPLPAPMTAKPPIFVLRGLAIALTSCPDLPTTGRYALSPGRQSLPDQTNQGP
jgi:hypothetical protein